MFNDIILVLFLYKGYNVLMIKFFKYCKLICGYIVHIIKNQFTYVKKGHKYSMIVIKMIIYLYLYKKLKYVYPNYGLFP